MDALLKGSPAVLYVHCGVITAARNRPVACFVCNYMLAPNACQGKNSGSFGDIYEQACQVGSGGMAGWAKHLLGVAAGARHASQSGPAPVTQTVYASPCPRQGPVISSRFRFQVLLKSPFPPRWPGVPTSFGNARFDSRVSMSVATSIVNGALSPPTTCIRRRGRGEHRERERPFRRPRSSPAVPPCPPWRAGRHPSADVNRAGSSRMSSSALAQ